VDGAANPYLALGGVIAAGLDGLRRQRSLRNPAIVDPATLSEEERQARSIERLPTSLAEAVAALENNSVLRAALGQPLATTLEAVRLAEWQAMKDCTLEEEVTLLLERY
jgi:glutamine synthetase